jgi:hypothetical protein
LCHNVLVKYLAVDSSHDLHARCAFQPFQNLLQALHADASNVQQVTKLGTALCAKLNASPPFRSHDLNKAVGSEKLPQI